MKIMKTRYFKSLLLLIVLCAATLNLGAQTLREEDKKEFPASVSTELSIKNQFGNITVTDWDQNKVEINYVIEVTHSDEAKAKKLMDRIKVEITENGNRISAVTKFGDDDKMKINNGKGDKQTLKIDYFVKCPKNISVSLDNQFGDMIISSFTGSFSADLQFGSLSAVSLTGPEVIVDLQFGKMTIGTLKNAKIDVQHCGLLKINEAGNLTVDAQFSKLELGSVTSLKADLNHSNVDAEYLSDMLKLEINMGNVSIGNVSASFKSIAIDQNMGELTIGIDPKAGYQIDAEVNMGSLKLPEGIKVTKEKDSDLPGVTAEKITGTFGNGSSSILINTNMGSVRIK
jgi:hypothetical protein